MKFKGTTNNLILTARDKIKAGQPVVKLYKYWCRLATVYDKNFMLAVDDAKKGEKLEVYQIRPDDIWEIDYIE